MSDPGHLPSAGFGTPQPLAPPWPPAAAPRPPRERRVLAAVLVAAATLALFVASAVVGRPDDGTGASAAMTYVPPSGTRVVLQTSDGKDEVDEYSVTRGIPFSQSGPTAVGYAADGSFEDAQRTTWLRVRVLVADAAGTVAERQSQIYAVLSTGLELRVAAWDDQFLVFRPGLLMLPAGVRDGQTWSVAGTAGLGTTSTVDTELPFSAEFAATSAADDCVAVATDLQVGKGTAQTRDTSSVTWCPGRGMVAGTGEKRNVSQVQRTPAWLAAQKVTAPPALPDPSSAGRLDGRDLNGAAPMSLGSRLPPVLLPDRVLVYAAQLSGDLIARGWDDGKTNARWSAHPGGSVTGLVTVGGIVVVTTSERRVVAYGAQGEFLWQASLPDAAEVAPVRFGALVVVAGLDGSVTAFDAATGAPAWRVRTPNEIRQPPVVGEDAVTVLDQAGNLLSVASDGSVVADLSTDPPESFTVSGGLAVVASRNDSIVRAYRLGDGSVAWRTPVPGARISVTGVGDVVVFQQNDALVALRTADGTSAWQQPMRVTAVAALGDSLLASDPSRLYRLSRAGATLASWPTTESDLDSGVTGIDVRTADTFLFHNDTAYRWTAP